MDTQSIEGRTRRLPRVLTTAAMVCFALPFLTVLAPSERFARERGGRHERLTAWARQALLQAARWAPI